MPIYRQIFKKAATLCWFYPSLWVFGILATILSVNEINLLFIYSINPEEKLGYVTGLFTDIANGSLSNVISGISLAFHSDPGTLFVGIFILLIELLSIIILFCLTIISQGALINRLINLAVDKKNKLADNFRFGLKKFWPLVGFNIILQIVLWFLATIFHIAKPFLFSWPVIFFAFFFVTIVLVAITAFLTKFAILQSLLKDQKFIAAWKTGWSLFKNNWLISLEFAGLLFIVIWAINQLLSGVLEILIYFGLKTFAGSELSLIALLLLYLVFTLVQIILVVFYWASWILFFEYLLAKKTVTSRIVLGLQKIFKK